MNGEHILFLLNMLQVSCNFGCPIFLAIWASNFLQVLSWDTSGYFLGTLEETKCPARTNIGRLCFPPADTFIGHREIYAKWIQMKFLPYQNMQNQITSLMLMVKSLAMLDLFAVAAFAVKSCCIFWLPVTNTKK